jgi:hypothetical protein
MDSVKARYAVAITLKKESFTYVVPDTYVYFHIQRVLLSQCDARQGKTRTGWDLIITKLQKT